MGADRNFVWYAWISLLMLVAGCAGSESTAPEGEDSISDSSPPAGWETDDNAMSDGEEMPAGEDGPEFPEFPFPDVPKASARDTIDMAVLTDDINSATFGEISHRLDAALHHVGYPKTGYYSIPGGFALTTYLEQINPEGDWKEPRFSTEVAPRPAAGFFDYIYSLFTADPGYWRVIVFLITDQPVRESDVPPTDEEAFNWPSHGAPSLADLEHKRITPNHKCTVLIYEFQKRDRNSDPKPASLGLSVEKHLHKAQILDANGMLRGAE